MNEKTRISPNADPLADIDPAQRQGFDQQKIENAISSVEQRLELVFKEKSLKWFYKHTKSTGC